MGARKSVFVKFIDSTTKRGCVDDVTQPLLLVSGNRRQEIIRSNEPRSSY